ncbi:MAG: DUF1801 domain-containing protein [Pseudohongiellaceae bacterium]|jgi:hypothetical protein
MAVERLFLLSGASRREAELRVWFEARPGILGTLARQWFDVAKHCAPDVGWLLHDGCPVACLQDAAFLYVNVFRLHVNVGFYQGADLADPQGLLQGTGKAMRHVKVQPGTPLDEPALTCLIETAYADVHMRLLALGRIGVGKPARS